MGKRIMAVSLAAIMVLSGLMVLIPSSSDDVEAAEIPEGYIPVSTLEDLNRVSTGVTYDGYNWTTDAKYYQTNDIDISGYSFTSIPSLGTSGIYDGGGHKIIGLRIKIEGWTPSSGNSYIGLFTRAYGQIIDLGLVNVNIDVEEVSSFSIGYIGGIAGNATNITNCYVSGSIKAVGVARVGGIAGGGSTFTNCYVSGNIEATKVREGVGGIVGVAANISNSHNAATIIATTAPFVGGIVGCEASTTLIVTQSYNTGDIIITGTREARVGGIAGQAGERDATPTKGKIVECYNSGNITANTSQNLYVGGIVGRINGIDSKSLDNNYNSGNITAISTMNARVGGIAHVWDQPNTNLVKQSNYNIGNLTATTAVYPIYTSENKMYPGFYSSDAVYSAPTIGGWGDPKTNVEMRSQSTYVSFDFDVIWSMGSGSYPYPVLRATLDNVKINSVPTTEVVSGNPWSYIVVTDPSDAKIAISGVTWLSVANGKISGVAPGLSGDAESEDFILYIDASKGGFTSTRQEVTITVYKENPWTTTPIPHINVTSLGGSTYHLDASSSLAYETLLWDLGNGKTSNALTLDYTFPSGVYDVTLTAKNPLGSVSTSTQIISGDGEAPTIARYGEPYIATLELNVGTATPTLSGCPWLSVTDYGPNYVIIQGIPSSIAYVDKTYNVTLTIGTDVTTWSVKVVPGSSWPNAGFTVKIDGLTVTLTSTATNAERTYYSFSEGWKEEQTISTITKYTYLTPGTYTITQTVRANVDSTEITDTFSRIVTVSVTVIDPDTDIDGDEPLHDNLTAIIIALVGGILTLIMAIAGRFGLMFITVAIIAILAILAYIGVI